MDVIKEWWPILAFVLALAGWCCREVFLYFKRRHDAFNALERRVDSQRQEHDAHEDICSRRYSEIAQQMSQLKEVGDDRHHENLGRFDDVVEGLENVKKILMERK